MEKFPVLGLIVRFGLIGSQVLAGLVLILVLAIAWPFWGLVAILPAIVLAALAYLVARSYVELVLLITDMLVPH
jgi:hypothetical protein